MSFETIMTYIVNNILILAAGGLLALWAAFRVWKKFEQYFNASSGWGDLAFFAGKAIVILAIMGYVASTIWDSTKGAVDAAINSGSLEAAGQLAVDLGAAVDYAIAGSGEILPGGNDLHMANTSVNAPLITGSTLNLGAASAPAATGAESTKSANDGTVSFNGPWNATAYDEDAPPAFTGPWAPEYYQGAQGQQNVSDHPGEYVVAPGDSLSRIAKHVYGDGKLWTIICNANANTLRGNCSNIRVGMRLVIPDRTTAPQLTPVQVQPRGGAQNAAAISIQNQPAVQPTQIPLVLMAAQDAAPPSVPLVLLAAQDQPAVQPTQIPLVLMAAQN